MERPPRHFFCSAATALLQLQVLLLLIQLSPLLLQCCCYCCCCCCHSYYQYNYYHHYAYKSTTTWQLLLLIFYCYYYRNHVYVTTNYLKLSPHLNNSHCLLMFLFIALCCQCHLKQPTASLWWDCCSRQLFSWLWVFIPLGWVTCLPLCTWLGSTKSYNQKSAESNLLTNSNNRILSTYEVTQIHSLYQFL